MFCVTHEKEMCEKCRDSRNAGWVVDEKKGMVMTTQQAETLRYFEEESSDDEG